MIKSKHEANILLLAANDVPLKRPLRNRSYILPIHTQIQSHTHTSSKKLMYSSGAPVDRMYTNRCVYQVLLPRSFHAEEMKKRKKEKEKGSREKVREKSNEGSRRRGKEFSTLDKFNVHVY